MSAQAYYSARDRCWYVPVSCELWQEAEEGSSMFVEPVRLEMRDGQLWITRLEPSSQERV